MIVLVAVLQVAEGKGNEVVEEFKKLVPTVLQDPGTISYNINQAADNPDKVMVYEKYEDMDALKYHGQTEHFKAFGQATRSLFAGRPEITLYNEVV
ncbi:MAG TPA: putative quinol monooxygenase [Dehalococcoidales bacterium]|nr:putative quinol monooxygenase [Dehalococcoidales bacterium]